MPPRAVVYLMIVALVALIPLSGCADKEAPATPPSVEQQTANSEQQMTKPAAITEQVPAVERQAAISEQQAAGSVALQQADVPVSQPSVPVTPVATPALASAGEKILFSFEKDTEGWDIPEWAYDSQDYKGKVVAVSKENAKEGAQSLKLDIDLPGKVWTGGLVEVMQQFDFGPYGKISCDVFVPKTAPEGLKAKMIITVGDGWKFTEMARPVMLIPGVWTHVEANLMPESDDWKATVVDDAFRKDVRKIAIRVESNRQPAYAGPAYIDNIKVAQ